jgi:hypothetical protein
MVRNSKVLVEIVPTAFGIRKRGCATLDEGLPA